MRKVLLSGTALVAALTFAPAARAELEVNIGGFVTAQAGFFDNDQANSSDRDFRTKSEIRVKVSGETESGLKYGARVDLLANPSQDQNSRRTGIYLEGGFGRVEFGDLDGAVSQLSVLAPTVGIGQINGSYVNFIATTSRPAGDVIDTGGGMIRTLGTNQATKITYYSPRMSGFRVGASFAPEVDDGGSGEQVQLFDNVGNQHNAYELGLNYRKTFSNKVRFEGGVTYTGSEAKDGSGREDVSSWGVGAQVGYKNFTFGGGYVDNGDSNNNAGVGNDGETAWNIGGRYTTGPWGVAVSYINEDYDANGGRGVDTSGGSYSALVFGGTYKIADGLTTSADLAFFDRNKDTGTDDNGYVLVLETKAAF